MKKDFKKAILKKRDALAVKVAKHYANVSCPLITFQPELPKEVKKLRSIQENK